MYINNQVKFKFYYFFSTNLRGIFLCLCWVLRVGSLDCGVGKNVEFVLSEKINNKTA